jgi:hypothetical protein
MKIYSLILLAFLFLSCGAPNHIESNTHLIAYKIPYKVEQLLLKEIEKNPKKEYCLLIELKDGSTYFKLVKGYSYYHTNTSYRALIGEEYYPISFPQFDMKYGVVTNAIDYRKYKIEYPDLWDNYGKQAYPLYHEVYQVVLNSENEIVSEGGYY